MNEEIKATISSVRGYIRGDDNDRDEVYKARL